VRHEPYASLCLLLSSWLHFFSKVLRLSHTQCCDQKKPITDGLSQKISQTYISRPPATDNMILLCPMCFRSRTKLLSVAACLRNHVCCYCKWPIGNFTLTYVAYVGKPTQLLLKVSSSLSMLQVTINVTKVPLSGDTHFQSSSLFTCIEKSRLLKFSFCLMTYAEPAF